jgi:multiple sugar transport system permease protein
VSYEFVGFSNYIRLLKDPYFWAALRHDLVWTAGTVGLSAIIGLLIALLLNKNLKLRNFARGLILFPYIVPIVVVTLVWRYMLNDLYGVISYLLSLIGVDHVGWFSSPRMAMLSVIIVGTWKFFPFVVIALLGRLQIIPLEPYEAARVDGANAWQTFRYLTWPAILPIFLLTILLRIIWTFNKFEHIYMLTGGGPVGSTITLPILVYNKAFQEYKMGEAATTAVLMLLVLLIAAFIYLKAEKRLHDNDE